MRNNEQGFTLLEVLVAFSILVVSLGSIYKVFIGGLRNEQIAQHQARALLEAQSLLAAAGLTGPWTASAGSLDNGLTWAIDVKPLDDQASGGGSASSKAYWVTAAVTWADVPGAQHRSVELTALKFAGVQ